MRILIIEDEVHLADSIAQILKDNKYSVDTVYNGVDGLDWALSDVYDVILLDIMLPGLDGFEVVNRLRMQKNQTPVLILSARDEISYKVKGLDCGADDYLTKPFSPDELLARIRALSRRQGEVVLNDIKFHDLTLGLSTYVLSCGKKSVNLGFKEFEVMRFLISNPKIVLSKDELIVKIWGIESDANDNNVEAYISFLRKKLVYLGSKTQISTVRRVGYRLEESLD